MKYSYEEIYLMKKDKFLKSVIQKNNSITFKPTKTSYFHSMINIVISQFISTTAAAAISKKILIQFKTNTFTPSQFINLSIKEIKSLGLSTNKSKSIKEISRIFHESNLSYKLNSFSEADLDEVLLSIYGVGPWSLQMFKLFKLGYTDIFSSKDAALRKAMEMAGMVKPNSPEVDYDQYSKKWVPYRSIASIHLWASLN
jgi:3-methyladenine DNA glycosylase/8-oxoguanine DNA glycosylase